MRFSEVLSEFTIKTNLAAHNKDVAIRELVDLLVEQHEISLVDRSDVLDAVFERERVVSTGMEHGVALPHGAVDAVDDIIAAMGISAKGVDFQSIDGNLTYIIILLILPADRGTSSVQTMGAISRLLCQQRLRDKIRRAETPSEVMDVMIEEEDQQILAKADARRDQNFR